MRKLSIILASLLLLSMMLAVVQAGASPRIEKVTFIHYLSPSSSKPTWDENEDDYRLISGGIRWTKFPVVYEVNLAGSGLEDVDVVYDMDGDETDEPDALEALQLASEEWDDGAYSQWGGVSIDLFKENPTITDKGVGFDGYNVLVWSVLDEGVIAVTHIWYNPATKEIVEFDIEFNSLYPWSCGLEAEDGKMDLQNIATHELGHGVGLGDLRPPKDWALTMFAYSDFEETIKRDLGRGDQLGVKDLYEP